MFTLRCSGAAYLCFVGRGPCFRACKVPTVTPCVIKINLCDDQSPDFPSSPHLCLHAPYSSVDVVVPSWCVPLLLQYQTVSESVRYSLSQIHCTKLHSLLSRLSFSSTQNCTTLAESDLHFCDRTKQRHARSKPRTIYCFRIPTRVSVNVKKIYSRLLMHGCCNNWDEKQGLTSNTDLDSL